MGFFFFGFFFGGFFGGWKGVNRGGGRRGLLLRSDFWAPCAFGIWFFRYY